MDSLECKGKTVDEAVFSGLMKMDLSIDEVKIEILDEGGSLFKSAKVKLTKKPESEVTEYVAEPVSRDDSYERDNRAPRQSYQKGPRQRNDSRRPPRDDSRRPQRQVYDKDVEVGEPQNEAEVFLQGMFERMGIKVALKSVTEDGILKVDMSGRNMGMLIGRRGETLDALQYLTSLVLNNGKEDYTKVMLDTEDYRKKREDTLRRLAARLADKVQKSGKRVVLEPMNPYERRILHSTLQDFEDVYTYSEGEDPYRSVVVSLKSLRDEEPEAGGKSN